MSGSLYVHLVAWAAPHVTSLDGRLFVNPRGARPLERGLLQRVVPAWILRKVGSLVQILKSQISMVALYSKYTTHLLLRIGTRDLNVTMTPRTESTFSKVLSILPLYSKYTRAQTFQNV